MPELCGEPSKVGELEERVTDAQPVVGERLVPPDVESGGELRVLHEVPVERRFVDDGPAGDVHEDRAGPHPVQLTRADEAARGRRSAAA